MALPLVTIAKLIGQLTVLVPAAESLLRSLRGTVSQIPANPSAAEHLDDMERALKLQVEVTENLTSQLHMIQSALGGIQKSLKFLTYTIIGVGMLAVVAIAIALSK
ncbi:MAG TPA: hypothetical protein VIH18_18315 [Candidatus Binatia bacterium]|jgi:hypothetical protein